MLILKALSLGSLHGYGIIQRIRQLSDELLEVEQGSLYPAVYIGSSSAAGSVPSGAYEN
jgi:PadR family transcriptional regulator, regulatory protein PadR